MTTTIISGVNASDQARLHIGDNNEYHEHRHYVEESQLPPAERQRAREDAILSSLSFPDMSARERAIDSPCDNTFGWIFGERVVGRERYREKDVCNLMSRWLEHEDGMFFIVGKAGSGKSTLMRFLALHKKTGKLLRNWAEHHDCTLAVCAHYFWCSGGQLQCSQEGLWRSVLYAIAKTNRNLASAMFADRSCDNCQTLEQVRSQPWARNDLIRALSLLVGQLEVQNVAVCLFIDGLDEFQGDEMMLIAELRQLLKSPYIKICASSRPRNLFEQAFGHDDSQWKLALHLLTRGDMVQLTRTRLYEDDAFCKLVDRGDRREDFIAAITDKSQGVFLWTVLVIREMIREAHQAGTIDELKARLEALPVEICGEKGMYQRIVERSDPRYRKYMARLLLVMLEAGNRYVYLGDVHFLYEHSRDAAFATRECLGLDDKYRITWDRKDVEAAIEPWEDDFGDTSCRGLFLACHHGRSGAHPRGVNCRVHHVHLLEDTRRQIRKWCPDFVDTHHQLLLRFSHRSVGEYLSLPEIRKRLIDLAGQEFDPVLTGCCLRLAHSRLQPPSETHHLEFSFLEMVACVGLERRESVRAILPEFERIQDNKWSWIPTDEDERLLLEGFWAKSSYLHGFRDIHLHGGFDISRDSQAHAWFLALVARKRLMWYCLEHWSRIPASDRQATGTIIMADLLPTVYRTWVPRETVDLMQCLIRSGVNPNTKYTWIKYGRSRDRPHPFKASLWEVYVETFPEFWMLTSENIVLWALEVMQLLLHDGHADRNCSLPAGKKSILSALTIEPKGNGQHNRWWNMFAGRLHEILDAHELLTREERHVAKKQGWLSTKLKAPRSPQTTLTQSATEPDTSLFSGWIRKLKEWEEAIRP